MKVKTHVKAGQSQDVGSMQRDPFRRPTSSQNR
jgi:hypothetical protein